jgi:hypothetical protein
MHTFIITLQMPYFTLVSDTADLLLPPTTTPASHTIPLSCCSAVKHKDFLEHKDGQPRRHQVHRPGILTLSTLSEVLRCCIIY